MRLIPTQTQMRLIPTQTQMRLTPLKVAFLLGSVLALVIWCCGGWRSGWWNLGVIKALPESDNKTKGLLFLHFPDYYGIETILGTAFFSSCAKKCYITTNSSRLDDADAVLFYSHHQQQHTPLDPAKKNPNQKWIFFASESPANSHPLNISTPAWRCKFDWTMTYRYDSDFFHGYGRLSRRYVPASFEQKTADVKKWKENFRTKTRLVAWFVSNCKTESFREKYVEQLSRYIPVDVYGNCGSLKCEDRRRCLEMLTHRYKFYLAFENSLCTDYVTEKLFNVFKLNSVVPVVRGGADYRKHFPPGSVIDTNDFPSPERLASFLKHLAQNESAYVEKLQWSWDYQVLGPSMPLCQICQLLHSPHTAPCVYQDVAHWWAKDTCYKPRDLPT
ncbi:alpha-(1,3)-fucosyltransferase C-like [Physella acuta]|uniref:alpha-(1,3)-fucosyltransferase C-like n=1 Tax=Physella acuta TaxID=109671 RepID=UPI0027DE9AA6|nr:alpha-(1,3)-fucosyltransferase C-like [Physella acuta]